MLNNRCHSHVVLDEPLDFVVGEFVFAEFDGRVLKLIVESWRTEQDDTPGNRNSRAQHRSSEASHRRSQEVEGTQPSCHLLSIDAVALEQSLGVGVGEAVVVPQGAGGLQELSLSCALVISKEP